MGFRKKSRAVITGCALVVLACVISISAPLKALADTAWSTVPSVNEVTIWRGITWAPELHLFVAVGQGTSSIIMTSSDGITWTPQTAPIATYAWRGVTWSPEEQLFVAVGQPASGTNPNIITSPDGVNWTFRNLPSQNALFTVTWSPDRHEFLALRGPTGGTFASPDGVTWTQTALSAASPLGTNTVIWSSHDNQYVSTRSTAANVYTSPDGVTWTTQVTPITSLGLVYSETKDLYVAVGASGIMTSSDAVTWSPQTSPVTNLHAVTWSPDIQQFAAVGTGGIVTSSDGITWTAATTSSTNNWASIVWSSEKSRYVAVSNDGTNRVLAGIYTAPAPNGGTGTPTSTVSNQPELVDAGVHLYNSIAATFLILVAVVVSRYNQLLAVKNRITKRG